MSLVVSDIFIYPVKALGGISVKSARVQQKGLEFDRRWMLIDPDNQFLTQRNHAKLALFKLRRLSEGFEVRYQDNSIVIPFESSSDPIQARIWDDEVVVSEVDSKLSRWFSDLLQAPVRLVSFPEDNSRPVDRRYKVAEDHVSLADGYPILVVGQSSLDDLNDRMSSPVPMNRFRPNVVFKGGDPFEEDFWSRFTIGSNRFAGVKPCKRCNVPTIDQETGVSGKEPTTTLSRFRRYDNGVIFGQNVIPIDLTEIAVGMPIRIDVRLDKMIEPVKNV